MALAARLGVHQTYVSRRMSGQVPWSAAELVEVAEFLEVSPSELLPSSERAS